ncbi:MAG: hypothetical protein GY804_12320 [Alphaproteobacteria bacterium]|nr:hypothetical protein [Alphaproteobacteria bacterium]
MKTTIKTSIFNRTIASALGIATALSLTACAQYDEKFENPYVVDYRENNKLYVQKKKERFILTALGKNVHLPKNSRAFDDFVDDYIQRGDSKLEVLVPGIKKEGKISKIWADSVNAELKRRGVNPAKIETRIIKIPKKNCISKCILNENGIPFNPSTSPCKPRPIVLRFLAYKAKLPKCGAYEAQYNPNKINQPSSNFGCATQRNIGLMASNPKDLIKMRKSDGAMATRTADILEKYAAGLATPSEQDLNSTVSSMSGGN